MEEGDGQPMGEDGKEKEQQTDKAKGEETEGSRGKDLIGVENGEIGGDVQLLWKKGKENQ